MRKIRENVRGDEMELEPQVIEKSLPEQLCRLLLTGVYVHTVYDILYERTREREVDGEREKAGVCVVHPVGGLHLQ